MKAKMPIQNTKSDWISKNEFSYQIEKGRK
jgi:hypothetical protein